MFRNKQFFDWTHFKEKLALHFPKRTYAKSPVVDAQISNILALLKKIENKYSVTSKQVIVEDVSISVATVFSGEIASPLVEENSSHVDNVESLPNTFINDLSGHVDNMLDEMSIRVYTKEIRETSFASSCIDDLDDIKSPKVFNECFPSYCPPLVAEVQPDTPNKMLDEEASCPKHSEAQLIDECSPKDVSKRYVTFTFLVRSCNKPKIEFETFEDMYLAEFFSEPATIEDLYYEKQILEIEDCIPQSTMPSDELMLVVEHGNFTCEFNTHNILCQFSFNHDGIVLVLGDASNLYVWDPGISFKSKALIGYTVNTKPLLLLGSIGTVGFIAYANSMTQVWDPEQPRYEMVIPKSTVHDTYSEVNPMFDDSSQRATSREIQPIAPLDIIRLLELFRFPQRLLAQLIGGDFALRKKISEQASALKMEPEGKEVTPIVCIAWLQGCIKSRTKLIEHLLRNFSTLEDITIFFGAQGVLASYATGPALEVAHILVGYGADEFIILIMHDTLELGDKTVDFPPNFSLYEFAALQACENNHQSLAMIYSEVELVKGASIVDAYVVHKSVLVESKNTSILVSCGKFITITRLMCYLAHFGGHRSVEERTVAEQIQLAELGKASGSNENLSPRKLSSPSCYNSGTETSLSLPSL